MVTQKKAEWQGKAHLGLEFVPGCFTCVSLVLHLHLDVLLALPSLSP